MTASPSPAFSPLNDLEVLLMAASSGGAAERAAFEAAVPTSKLWAVVADEDAATDTLRLRTVTPKDGRPATAIFTAKERALAGVTLDARLDVGVRAPEAPVGIGLEIVAPRD